MRKKFIALIILFAILITVVIILLSNPLRISEERIRTNMLRITPIGMSMDNVIEVIEDNHGWEIRHTFNHGYIVGRWPDERLYVRGPHQGSYVRGRDVAIVGVTSMEVHIGSYNFLLFALETRVSVFFGFDEDLNLVDLGVRKYAMDTL